ncbi:MAG: glucosaminidase domain-containing protein [Saprospiraceae bacterium]|nr:glucosaminidase domain-containing protein [Saprospiraceae bacterium]
MSAYQSNSFSTARRGGQPMARGNRSLDKSVYATIYDVTLGWILKKLWQGLVKLFIAIKYQFYKSTEGFFGTWRFSWFKIGLAGLAIFIVLKKDVQFSINMKAPNTLPKSSVEQVARPTQTSNRSEELSMAKGFSLWGKERAKIASINELDEQRVKGYIRRFTKVAQAEMGKYGIPASVKMAQGILESRAGEVENGQQINNHFGEPLAGRPYESAWENWRAHSLLLKDQYPQLFESGTNYRQWAKSLKELGYNKDKNYDDKLMEAIEKYQLYLLDEM